MPELTSIELEARLFRQERRILALLKNYRDRNQFEKTDPRYESIMNALVWKLLFLLMPASAVVGVGALGLWFAYSANVLIGDQNEYFREQNEAITGQFESAERTSLLRTLYEVKELTWFEKIQGAKPEPVATTRSRTEAFLEFLKLERRRLDRLEISDDMIDLTGAQLQNIFIYHMNVDITNVRLIHGNLTKANLVGANLNGAYLSEANLTGANLTSANLDSATLNFAILNGASLGSANLEGANLNGARLSEAFLNLANLERVNLEGANLEGAHLYGASFVEANLVGASLNGANLERTRLVGANLTGASLFGVNLNEANFQLADLTMALVDDPNWIAETKSNAEHFESERWQLEPHVTDGVWMVVPANDNEHSSDTIEKSKSDE